MDHPLHRFDLSAEVPALFAAGAGRGAAVVFMPSAFGLAEDVAAQMRELAIEASVVVAFDALHRYDPGVIPYTDRERIMRRIAAMDPERIKRDVRSAIEWVRGEAPNKSVVMIGVCIGGFFAFDAAADRAVDGLVTWHGTRMQTQLHRAANVVCPMRLHFGEKDPLVPADALDAIRAAFATHADAAMTIHPGATHGFSHRDAPPYDAAAERAAMASARALIEAAPDRPRP